MIYLDHAATSPLHPEVLEAMQPYMSEHFGNPSSVHHWGRKAKAALDRSRTTIAELLHTHPNQLIFTSGGTESDNMALIGVALAYRDKGRHIITSQIEHHAVLHTCSFLEKMGYEVTYLPVDETGKVSLADLEKAIRPDTILASIMYGNNEVGTIQDIEAIGHLLQERNVLFHSDGVQALGSLSINLDELPVDLMSFSAHKINGPKGVGALYLSRNVKHQPISFGGAQEKKRRAGTENVAGIVGFATAAKIAYSQLENKRKLYQTYRETILNILNEANVNHAVNGHATDYLPHILNISFYGFDTESILMNLDLAGIAASSGSACASGSLEPSHVLVAMGLEEERLRSAVRFSFGLGNTLEQIQEAAKTIVSILKR
jgi:cysteine desulfurase